MRMVCRSSSFALGRRASLFPQMGQRITNGRKLRRRRSTTTTSSMYTKEKNDQQLYAKEEKEQLEYAEEEEEDN